MTDTQRTVRNIAIIVALGAAIYYIPGGGNVAAAFEAFLWAMFGVGIAFLGLRASPRGISPALAAAANERISPHARRHARRTIAGSYVPGTLVNLEVDVVARYVERLLGRRGLEGRH